MTPKRAGNFEHFDADESIVGKRCIICINDLEVGTKIVLLDCHVDHYLCKNFTNCLYKDYTNYKHAFN